MNGAPNVPAAVAPGDPSVITRQQHYAEFFGLSPVPDRYGVVVGNCQAESLRIVLDAPDRRFLRVPPVHEMTADEAARLHEIITDAAYVVTQPIRPDYRGLPLGTRQLAAATGGAVLTVPSVRFAGLQPFQAAIRVPGVDEDPPIVAYHDVRTLAEAGGIATRTALEPGDVRRVAQDSLGELRAREQHIDVPVSDLYGTGRNGDLTAEHARTVNHPGNAIWLPLGARVLEALGLDGPVHDPGRPLLASVRSPLIPEVVEAWSLTEPPRTHWLVEGRPVDDADVREAHRRWYAAHPAFVDAALTRLAPLLARWRS
ncbi:WcbI family polysaccharide biosynthesis putative acetyltransferase [Microbacterium sp. CCNWLW134]|uniref:WcbI family polysaccharide biosynthesis putative acetyltransferase n=1 Tax=Microbacterium sp. CCNWLW134 TaxID=3122064 RepID=UPI00300FAF32